MLRVSDASGSYWFLNIRHFEITIGDKGGQRSWGNALQHWATSDGKSQYAVAKLLGRGTGVS
jgi:hypothetical protein